MLTLEPIHTRGERNYVHGTDLFSQLLMSIRRVDFDITSLYLKINKPIQRQPKIVENELQANASAIYRYKTEYGEKFGSIIEGLEDLGAPISCIEEKIRKTMRYNGNFNTVIFNYDNSLPLINFLLFGSKHLLKEIYPNRDFWFSSIAYDFPNLEYNGDYTLNVSSNFSKIFKIEAIKDRSRLAMISGILR